MDKQEGDPNLLQASKMMRSARYRARAMAVFDIHEAVRAIQTRTLAADWQDVKLLAQSIARQAELLLTAPELQLTLAKVGEKVRIETEAQEQERAPNLIPEETSSLGTPGDPDDFGGVADQEGD